MCGESNAEKQVKNIILGYNYRQKYETINFRMIFTHLKILRSTLSTISHILITTCMHCYGTDTCSVQSKQTFNK